MAKRLRWVVLSAGVILCAIILAFSACTPSLTPPLEIEEGLLILSHSTYLDEYGYFHVVGEVQNAGENNTEQNTILASFFDENGVVYAASSGPCYKQIIAPDEKSPFDIIFLKTPRGDNYRLTATWQTTDMEPREQVTFRDVMSSMDAYSRYVVTGEIVNEGPNPIDHAMIICTCYDVSSKVVAVSLSFAAQSPIQVASSSNFTLILDPSVSADIDHLSLQAEVQ